MEAYAIILCHSLAAADVTAGVVKKILRHTHAYLQFLHPDHHQIVFEWYSHWPIHDVSKLDRQTLGPDR